MTTGQAMVGMGIVCIISALLIVLVGSVILHRRKKKILQEIEHEYR